MDLSRPLFFSHAGVPRRLLSATSLLFPWFSLAFLVFRRFRTLVWRWTVRRLGVSLLLPPHTRPFLGSNRPFSPGEEAGRRRTFPTDANALSNATECDRDPGEERGAFRRPGRENRLGDPDNPRRGSWERSQGSLCEDGSARASRNGPWDVAEDPPTSKECCRRGGEVLRRKGGVVGVRCCEEIRSNASKYRAWIPSMHAEDREFVRSQTPPFHGTISTDIQHARGSLPLRALPKAPRSIEGV